MLDLNYKADLPSPEEKTLSALVGEGSVFYCLYAGSSTLYESNYVDRHTFFSEILPANEALRKKFCNQTNKFVISNNTAHLEGDDFKVFVDKFTDKSLYCKHIGGLELPDRTIHLSTALDHHYYLTRQTVLHVHFEIKRIHLYYKADGQFMFYNNYEIETAEDVLYYIELIHNVVISNDQKRMPLEVSGMVERQSAYVELLAKYYPEINFVSSGVKADGERLSHIYFGHYLNLSCE